MFRVYSQPSSWSFLHLSQLSAQVPPSISQSCLLLASMQRTRCSAFGQEHHSQQTPFDLGVVFAAIAGVNALPRKRHPASTMKMNILMTHTPQR